MKCPVCHELMMVLELEKVEIDYCVLCRGIWLDEGELEMLLESAGQKDRFLKSLAPEKGISEKKIRCPVCRKKMDKISFLTGSANGSSESRNISGQDAKTKIIVDGCPRYHGLWFDRGELSQALAGGGLSENHEIYRLLELVFTESKVE